MFFAAGWRREAFGYHNTQQLLSCEKILEQPEVAGGKLLVVSLSELLVFSC